MKLVVTGDWHLHHKAPRSSMKTDAEWLEYQAKILQALAKVENTDGELVCTGDIFHSPKTNYETYFLLYDNVDCLWSTVGNHDCVGNNSDELSPMLVRIEDSPLEIFVRSHGFCVYPALNARMWFYGDNEPETEAFLKGEMPDGLDANYLNIAVVHATVGYGESPYWTDVQTLDFPGFDYVLFGDVHTPFQYRTKSGCLCINPGSMIPRNVTENHIPSCVVIDLDANTVETVNLVSEEECNHWRDRRLEAKTAKVDMEEVLDIITQHKNQKVSPADLLEKVAEKTDIFASKPKQRKAVINRILSRL